MVIECQLLSIIDEDRNMQYVSLAESFLTVNKKDESHGVQKNTLLSLKERTGQDFGKDYEAWRRWWEQNK